MWKWHVWNTSQTYVLMLFCFREFVPLPFLLWDPPMMLVCLERVSYIYKYVFKVDLAGGVGSSWLLSDSHTAQCFSSDGAKCVRNAETLLVSTLHAPPTSAHTHSYSSYSSTWPLNTHTHTHTAVRHGRFHGTLAGRDTHQASIPTGLSPCVLNGPALMI